MSWYRKIKIIYSISLVTISFIIWSTLSKWLFSSPVDYKLFLITLSIVLFLQYLSSKELKNTIITMVPLGLSIVASFIFFKEKIALVNTIFLLFMILTTHSMESSPVEHYKYKEDIRKSMIALLLIWIISFTLGIDFVNKMYKFHILYIIMIIILMRETRRYEYDVKGKNSMVVNVIIVVAVSTLSFDYAGKIVGKLFSLLMELVTLIVFTMASIINSVFGELLIKLIVKIKAAILKRGVNPDGGLLDKKFAEPPVIAQNGIRIPPMVILALEIMILLLILYIVYRFLSRSIIRPKKNNGFVEEKERIVRKRNKKHRVKDLLSKLFEGGGSNRDKILYTYKGFEKITEEVDIYKPYMTATQLKNVTKINVDNFDNLEEMTQVYNEAKFSLHDMTEKQLEQVKKGHNNIKKQL